MVSYFTRLKTNEPTLLALLSDALPPSWKMRQDGMDVIMEWRDVPPTRGDLLYIEFMNQLDDVKEAAKFIEGAEPVTCACAEPMRIWRNEAGQEIEVPVWISIKCHTGQGAMTTFGAAAVLDPSLSDEEQANERKRQMQAIAEARVLPARRRLLATGYSDRYRQVLDDWKRQGEPDVRALFAYVENMNADISKQEFKAGGKYQDLAKDFSAFCTVANNPRHYGIHARHGWGYHKIQPYNPEFAYMTKVKMLEFAKRLMGLWEEHLVHEAEAARGAKPQSA